MVLDEVRSSPRRRRTGEPGGFFSSEYEHTTVVTAEIVQGTFNRNSETLTSCPGEHGEVCRLFRLGGWGRGTWGLVELSPIGDTPHDRVFVFSPFELRVFEIARATLLTGQ